MICPKCGTENLRGKLLCYKCGAKLMQAPQAPKGRAKPQKRVGRLFFRLIVLGLLAIVVILMLQKPQMDPLSISAEATKRFKANLTAMERAILAGKPFKLEATEEEINSQIAGDLKDIEQVGRMIVDEARIRLNKNKLKCIISMKIKGKSIYISLSGKPLLINGRMSLSPDKAAVGKMPILPCMLPGILKQLKKGEGIPLPKFPPEAQDLQVEEGKLTLQAKAVARPVSPGKKGKKTLPERVGQPKRPVPSVPEEVKPAPEKRVLTEEELEEIRRRREESEAKSWLQVGDNFTNIEMYDSAIEYYRKVINKYPESEQAKKAKQRVEEVKSRLE